MWSQGLVLPTAMRKVDDATVLDGTSRIAGKYPAPMLPWPQRILAEPSPKCRAADVGDQAVVNGFAPQLAERPVCQGQATARGQFTGQRLDLDHDTGGEKRAGRPPRGCSSSPARR